MIARCCILLLVSALAICCASCAGNRGAKLDILVIAPHSDDEAIGCTTVISRAIAQHRRVGIVVVTAGDGHVKAAAALANKAVNELTDQDLVNLAGLRQEHTLEAMPRLGVDPREIFFLGYPDGGLATIFKSPGKQVFTQPLTHLSKTYGPVVADYHTRFHGVAAPYTRNAILQDLKEIIRNRRPAIIYTTDETDTHPDHATTCRFVREAAKEAGFTGNLFTYVVHGKPRSEPPTMRVYLKPEELRTKREIITLYQRGVSPVHDKLADEYAQPEEVFWTK